jgi:hypothetical protein
MKDAVVAFARARHDDGTQFDLTSTGAITRGCTALSSQRWLWCGRADTADASPRDSPSLRVALDWLKVRAPEIVTAGR